MPGTASAAAKYSRTFLIALAASDCRNNFTHPVCGSIASTECACCESGSVQQPKLAPTSTAVALGRSSSKLQISSINPSSGEAPVLASHQYCPASVSGTNMVP